MNRTFIKQCTLLLLGLLTGFSTAQADEGMWMLNKLDKNTQKQMKEMGLQLSLSELYSPRRPSLKDAIVSFGGFCSGVVVSPDGLVFTNHHCGFDAIQQHSSTEHDYLRDGFVSQSIEEELPNPNLFVSFLVRTEDVTKQVQRVITPQMDETERQNAIDSISYVLEEKALKGDTLLRAEVSPYYNGNEFYLSVYKDYYDVRLVYAPPSSVGKFGGDTDNWLWPRHTGDFSVFRIYADKNNQPASYSPENVPYHPVYYAPVSLNGYQEGDFCMTFGYPGETKRYLSSYGIEERTQTDNAAMIKIRGIKQKIWKDAMEKSDSIRIMYASKYAVSSNYWKNSIGMNQSIEKLKVIEKKRELEQEIQQWIKENPSKRGRYSHMLTDLELAYRNRRSIGHAAAFLSESFANGPELILQALAILNLDVSNENTHLEKDFRKILETYANIDLSIDKKVFSTMLKAYKEEVKDSIYLPEGYKVLSERFHNDYEAYTDYLYNESKVTGPLGLALVLKQDSTYNLFEDPAVSFTLDMIVKFFEFNEDMRASTETIDRNERLLNEALREMQTERNFYPDANSTMRLSYGIIGGYSPSNQLRYDYFTTTRGIFDKVKKYKGDSDFEVQPEVLNMLSERDFGRYATPDGEMNVCFISNNDITGGNSGSGMFNGRGELIGLAFDGNWEAMSSDLIYEPNLQRCIGVDIRYVLYMIEKYGKADRLIKELSIGKGK